jgi:conjugal transfer pilus assembly protein TraD
MAMRRWIQALRILTVRASLGGRAMQTIGSKELGRLCRDTRHVFLGFGFDWLPVHSQRLYELTKIDFRSVAVPSWLLWLLGYPTKPQPDEEVGLSFIHGIEPTERPIRRPLSNFEGGTNIVGTTQSGKGASSAS